MNIEIFLPGLNNPVLVSENKFGKIMDIVGRRFSLNDHGVIHFSFCRPINLSRYILGLSRFFLKEVDHRNHNQFDLTDENLRLATRAQNERNKRKINKKCSSIYKGVHFREDMNKWQATINIRTKGITKSKYLGCFKTEIEAALEYNKAAIKYFNEFAYLNIIK